MQCTCSRCFFIAVFVKSEMPSGVFSLLLQLYMIESIREGILAVEGAATDPNEDFSGEERPDHEVQPCEIYSGLGTQIGDTLLVNIST